MSLGYVAEGVQCYIVSAQVNGERVGGRIDTATRSTEAMPVAIWKPATAAVVSDLMNRASSVVGREETLSVNGSSGFDLLGLGFRATCFDGDLHSIFHRIFEGHLDSEQAVLVGRFGFVRFHRPT